jgi:hypothetical protein
VVSVILRQLFLWYALDRRLDGPQNLGRGGKGKVPLTAASRMSVTEFLAALPTELLLVYICLYLWLMLVVALVNMWSPLIA